MTVSQRPGWTLAASGVLVAWAAPVCGQFSTLVTDFEGTFSQPPFVAEAVFRDPGTAPATVTFLDPAR